MNYEHISEISDEEGRFVRATGRIEGSEITILNVPHIRVNGYSIEIFLI